MFENSAVHLQPLTLTAAKANTLAHQKAAFCAHLQARTHMVICKYSDHWKKNIKGTIHILVIKKSESKKFLLFEVEVGGHQVEEFVRQQLRLWGKI